MWPRQAHLMKPLTELTGRGSFIWTDRQQKAFDTLKSIMAADCLNVYPDYNQPFEIYTNARDYQLGAAIIQNKQHIAYWSRSLQSNQLKYTTTKKNC